MWPECHSALVLCEVRQLVFHLLVYRWLKPSSLLQCSLPISPVFFNTSNNLHNPAQLSVRMKGCSKLFLWILPSAQVAVGSAYLNECPRQPYIPIYLIVMGVFGLVLALLSCLRSKLMDEDDPSNLLRRFCFAWHFLLFVFLLCWFIAGNVWIYSIYEPNYNKTMTNVEPYCDKTLYLFSFWTTTLVYILLGLFLLTGCCVLLCSCTLLFSSILLCSFLRDNDPCTHQGAGMHPLTLC